MRAIVAILGLGVFACGADGPGSNDAPSTAMAASDDGGLDGSLPVGTAGSTASDAAPTGEVDCRARAEGIDVLAVDLDGYPPYAVDECQLVFVASPASPAAGALVLKDLTTGMETVLASATTAPRRPSISGDVIAWEAERDGLRTVHVRHRGESAELSGPFVAAGEPRATDDAVVFTGWLTAGEDDDTDVFLFTPSTGSVERVIHGPGQQRFADVSRTHIAASDFSEDVSGAYDTEGIALADIIVLDRSSGETTVLPREGKQAYPMLGLEGRIAYLDWTEARPVPKLAGYAIHLLDFDALGDEPMLVADVGTDPPTIRPAAGSGRIEWVEYVGSEATMWRALADFSEPASPVTGLATVDLYAPAPTASFSVLASARADTGATLLGVER